jgi:capsid protein
MKLLDKLMPVRAKEKQLKNKLLDDVLGNNKQMATGYNGAMWPHQRNRKYPAAGRVSFDLPEDIHLGSQRSTLRLEARNLLRNTPEANAISSRFATNVWGQGIMPIPLTASRAINKIYAEYYTRSIKFIDISGVKTFNDIIDSIVNALIFDGEIGVILLKDKKIQLIESESITGGDGPVDGVKTNKFGEVEGYYVAPRDEYGYPIKDQAKFIGKQDFILIGNFIRANQYRGVPMVASLLTKISDLADYQGAVLTKARLENYQVAVRKTDQGASFAQGLQPRVVNTEGNPQPIIEEQDWGMIYNIKPNESIQSYFASAPGSVYSEFVNNNLRLIASALGVSYEVLFLDFSNTSFSSARVGVTQSEAAFTRMRDKIINVFLDRLYRWIIRIGITEKHIPEASLDARGISEWYKVDWQVSIKSPLDAYRTADAMAREWELGITSVGEMAANKGTTGENLIDEKTNEIIYAIESAKRIKEMTGENIHWTQILKGTAPGTVSQELLKTEDIREEEKTETEKERES